MMPRAASQAITEFVSKAVNSLQEVSTCQALEKMRAQLHHILSLSMKILCHNSKMTSAMTCLR